MLLLCSHLTFKGLVDGFSIGVGNFCDFGSLFDGQALLVYKAAELHALSVREQGVFLDHSYFGLSIFNIVYYILSVFSYLFKHQSREVGSPEIIRFIFNLLTNTLLIGVLGFWGSNTFKCISKL